MLKKIISQCIEEWAPKDIAWVKDNPGLQAGSLADEAQNIFLCLELTEKALREAIKKKSNFIFTHHPLIFQPLKRLDTQNDKISGLIELLFQHSITLYSAHTNLDFTKHGVSFQLAKTLGLKNIDFLEHQENLRYKLVVFVPEESLSAVSEALFTQGAGKTGEYEKCSFHFKGEGTFRGSMNTAPAIGKAGSFEKVSEMRLEVVVDKWNLNNAVSSMLKVHPYEEPAYDIYQLANKNQNYGAGAIGSLDSEMTDAGFLSHVQHSLKTENLKYSAGSRERKIQKVAVCGGSGSDMLNTAIAKGADAFVTADVRYHTFQDADEKILLIDAGHYETEFPVLTEVKRRLDEEIKRQKSDNKVYIYSGTTNPVHFLINIGEE
ncbi:MAG: Nif3-like dinuclear metal center hexameric protein [Ignavibacteria bacterium]